MQRCNTSTLINNICKYTINRYQANLIIIIYKNNYKKIILKYMYKNIRISKLFNFYPKHFSSSKTKKKISDL